MPTGLTCKELFTCKTCNDREPEVPVSSGRGGGGIGGGEMVCRQDRQKTIARDFS